jgi:hypothetical protein
MASRVPTRNARAHSTESMKRSVSPARMIRSPSLDL